MARPKFSSPEQAPWIRWPLRVYEALASLNLAVFLIASLSLLLAWATWVDSVYGPKGAQFAIYGTWWFAAVLALLGVNVLCAALVRFPWQRYQTGFVITHLGILVLLAGCVLSRLDGIDAQMPILEDGSSHRAFEDSQHFELAISETSSAASQRSPQRIRVPFVAGPLNWAEYDQRFFFPWGLTSIDRGVIYDQDGIRLEVLDYMADAQLTAVEPLQLKARSAGEGAEGSWQQFQLASSTGSDRMMGRQQTNRQTLPSGVQILHWTARTQAETDAFLDSAPVGSLGEKGQLVLHAGGQKFHFQVHELKLEQVNRLGDTGVAFSLVQHNPQLSAVQLLVYGPDGEPRQVVVVADFPDWSDVEMGRGVLVNHVRELGVYGAYWSSAPQEKQESKRDGESKAKDANEPNKGRRIDLVEGADGRLYYRVWKSPQLEAAGPVPVDGSPIVAFAGDPLRAAVVVEKFEPSDLPGYRLRMVPFEFQRQKERSSARTQRRARVRLTVDGRTEEFWLDGIEKYPIDLPPTENQARIAQGDKRRVEIQLKWDAFEVGFDTYLREFSRKLDPGTSMASHYSSLVDFLDRDTQQKLTADSMLVTLNEPVDFLDPQTRRTYRVFQESYMGPFKPGDPWFDQRVASTSSRDQLFVSTLTVNYDPGRGLKYLGSLLIVAGVVVMFYMKAYFFKKRGEA